jgi:7-cyano-7-deazaguanine synthase in queuosine biosynthesis
MVGTCVIATPDVQRAQAVHGGNTIGVALFHAGTATLPGLGGNLRSQIMHQFPAPPSAIAWDFLSIALAVFAADRFVVRTDSEDGWTRVIALEVAVHDPVVWSPQAVRLAGALRFLTGDIWTITFSDGGNAPPNFQLSFTDRDTVSLFSGGLDSLLGALKLLQDGKKPFLISQGSTKEIYPQKYLAQMIGLENHRFEGRVSEHWRTPYEGSTRGRSIIFFAYGVLAASALNQTEVIVPENGLIAINPPLTPRRLGSLSTRTTHPHFLAELGAILQSVGLNVRLTNIFEGKSKGEMLAECQHQRIASLAGYSYSCGKGKRKNGQCGRCIPCLIRRASFHEAGMVDLTNPPYFSEITRSESYDDVIAARIAVARKQTQSRDAFERWVASSGPLPSDPIRREAIFRAVSKGLDEVESFLATIQWH